MSHPIVQDTHDKMDKTVNAFQEEMAGIRTGRATPAMLDVVVVEAYGQKMHINQLGTINVPDNNLVTIDLWDKSQINIVEKAIMNSPLGLMPANDGTLIRIPIPLLSEDRRRELVKVLGKQQEEAKVSLRNVRRNAMDEIKKLQKDGEIPEDDAHKLTDTIQKETDKHSARIDELFATKETDIMAV